MGAILRFAWLQEGHEGSDVVVVEVVGEQVETGLQECSLESVEGGRAQKDRIGSAVGGVPVGGHTKHGVLDLLMYRSTAWIMRGRAKESSTQ